MTPPNEKTALLFPGQGSQVKGMGRNLAEKSAPAMALWEKAEQYCGLPLRAIYWDSDDATQMSQTRCQQPAITVVNLALWQHVAGRISPCAAAGHSLGEFSALAAAGVLTPDEVLQLVALRGRLMEEADPEHIGTMYAVLRLGFEELDAAAREVSERTGKLVRVANRNTPGQFAVSGHKDAVEELIEHIKPQRGKAMPLAVSGAFHTPLMAEAAAEFAKELDKLTWRTPAFPLYCNVNGEAVDDAEKIHAHVRKQMTSSVFWIDTIGNQYKDGVRRFIEFGPQGVLTRMVRPILNAQDIADNAYTTVHIANLDAAVEYFGE